MKNYQKDSEDKLKLFKHFQSIKDYLSLNSHYSIDLLRYLNGGYTFHLCPELLNPVEEIKQVCKKLKSKILLKRYLEKLDELAL